MKTILIALAVVLSCFGSQGLDHYNGCATKDMTERDRQGQKNALALAKLKKNKRGSGYQANSPKVIPVCFHIIGQPIVRKITRRRLKKDLDALNRKPISSLSWQNDSCITLLAQFPAQPACLRVWIALWCLGIWQGHCNICL